MTLKICATCGLEKTVEEFTKLSTSKDGYNYDCRLCSREKTKNWKKNNKDKLRRYRQENNILLRLGANRRNSNKKGWTPPNFGVEIVEQALEKQNGYCEVCGDPFGKMGYYVDHDHKTGNFRGLLCYNCNVVEGNLRTSDNCLKMAAYLKKFETSDK